MAYILEVSNPFAPFDGLQITEHKGGISVRQWLELKYTGFVEFEHPTYCQYNGQPLLRKDWNTTIIQPNDRLHFITLPGTPIQILWAVVVLLVVSVVVLAVSMKTPEALIRGNTPEADPVYSLKGQRNQIRLGEPIECPYGKVRIWPSYAAASYNKYENNQQWLYQLFCLGHGSFDIEDLYIEDTPFSSYSDVEYEVVEPNGLVTLFPDNVVTSVEVSNIELFGTNEPEADAVWVEDSPGDEGLGIASTGHYGYSNATAFVANPSGTLTTLLELDISLPRGLYVSNASGGLNSLTITALFEAREIDGAGSPLTSWATIHTFTKTLATVTPQRFTVSVAVASARYEVRASRTNAKNVDARAGNTLVWESLRAFLPSAVVYGEVTMLAVKARASNNLNSNASSRVNVVATRKLPIWNGTTWSAPVATRSIVWAFCDVFRNTEYGGRLADSFLDLESLLTLDGVYSGRGEYLDWIFDQRMTVWDAARLIANVGRAVPMLNGSQVTMIRDDIKTLPTAIFNQENIVSDSFKWEIKLAGLDAKDGLEVEYVNSNTWKSETVVCLVGGEAGNDVEFIKLSGCTDRSHAYNWGMWRRAISRYQRENVVFRTGMEGHIPSFGDLISVCHDVPRWGQGGLVLAVAGDNVTLTLSEPVTFIGGTHKILLRKKNGDATDALTVTAGADAYTVVLDSALTPAEFSWADTTEPPLFVFGPSALISRDCKVASLAPADDNTVEVTAIPYRSEIYVLDGTPPAGGNNSGSLSKVGDITSVLGLLVVASPNVPNEVIATWMATRGANYYVVELSYDGATWERVGDFVEDTNYRFTVVPRTSMYVRVAAVTTGQGAWAYWVGTAPVDSALNTYVSYIFKRAATIPATPTGATPLGWSDGPPVEDGNPLWMSLATFNAVTDDILTVWSDPVNLEGAGIYVEYSVDGATSWHEVFNPAADLYMRQRIGVSGTWGDAIRIVGEQGADGGYVDHIFKRAATVPATPTGDGLPVGWSDGPPAADGNVLWMSVSFKNADDTVVGLWATPVQIEGDVGNDGNPGNDVFIEYSVDGSTSWHSTFGGSDIYMRQKIGSEGTWSAAIKIVGEDGVDGNYFSYVFKRSAAAPSTPTGDNPAGWYDSPPAPDGYLLWMSVGLKNYAGTLLTAWSTPGLLEGEAGDSISVEYSVDGSTSWHSTFEALDKYMRQRVGSGDWSIAIKIVGEDGAPGAAGAGTASVTIYWHGNPIYGGVFGATTYNAASSVITGLSPGVWYDLIADTVPSDTFSVWSGDTDQIENPTSQSTRFLAGGSMTIYADYLGY